MKEAIKFTVKGRVQGVGYRFFTYHLANKIGVYGYVKNLFTGDVEVYAIGTKEQLENLKQGLLKGPRFSSVEDVLEERITEKNNYISFSIKY